MDPRENLLRVYKELADCYERQRQPPMRDRFLVLAADAALLANRPDEAETLRLRLLKVNPHHLLKPYASFAQALKSPDVLTYIKDLRVDYPANVAEDLLRRLQTEDKRPPAPIPSPLRRPASAVRRTRRPFRSSLMSCSSTRKKPNTTWRPRRPLARCRLLIRSGPNRGRKRCRSKRPSRFVPAIPCRCHCRSPPIRAAQGCRREINRRRFVAGGLAVSADSSVGGRARRFYVLAALSVDSLTAAPFSGNGRVHRPRRQEVPHLYRAASRGAGLEASRRIAQGSPAPPQSPTARQSATAPSATRRPPP